MNSLTPDNITFSDAYLSYCKQQTDAPPIFHKFLSYIIISSVLNRKVYLKFGFKNLYPNLYLLIVAPSSAHRKSWSMGIAARMIRKIYPDFILPDVSSREAFVSEVCDQQRTVPGCGIIKIDELKGFMDRIKTKSYMDGFMQDLSSLYDNETMNRRKGIDDPRRFIMEEPFLNMMAACSNEWFYQSVQSGDISGGFLARFVWVVHEKPVINPSPWPKPEDAELFGRCLRKLERMKDLIAEVRLGDEAKREYEKWFQTFLGGHQGGQWDANYHRAPAIVVKIAMMNAVMRIESESTFSPSGPFIDISPGDMKLAIMLIADTHLNFGKVTIGATKSHTMAKRVVKFLMERGGTANRSEVLKGIRGISARYLSDVLTTLEEADIVTVSRIEGGKGIVIHANGNAQNYMEG